MVQMLWLGNLYFVHGKVTITSASITISQVGLTSAYNNNVVLYGGTSSSAVTNGSAWNAGSNTSGGLEIHLLWTSAGLISSITYIGGMLYVTFGYYYMGYR